MLSSHCDNMLPSYTGGGAGRRAVLLDHHHHHRRPSYRPNVEVAPSCPRCDSPNTKFCYYNNYSLSQPRYFCKGCRRYWTKGGSLRNVPVGGGCRKNRRAKSAAARSALAAGGAAAFSHRFPGTVRPDLLLEGMAGNPAGTVPGSQLVSVDKPAVSDGSAIDLALLYAKFLNQQPPAAVESADVTSSGSSSSDVSASAAPPPDQPFVSCHDGFANLSGEHGAAALQCPDFSVDQSYYDSLGLPTTELILPSTTWHHHAAKYEPFDSLPEEDAMSLRDSVAAGADDVWTSALACQGLEAALICRP